MPASLLSPRFVCVEGNAFLPEGLSDWEPPMKEEWAQRGPPVRGSSRHRWGAEGTFAGRA